MKKALNQIFLTLLFLCALQSQKTLSQDMTIDPGTITFEEGSYMGGDVIRRFRLRVTNIEVPTEPIKTVTSYRVDVHLSKDGAYNDVGNAQDDFALHILGGGPIGPGQSQEFTWNQLVPYNVEGQLFVVAKVTTVIGPVDPKLDNNSYKPSQGARLNLIPTKGFDAGLISKTSGGTAPAGFSDSPSLSSDARYVAFTSTARDLSFSNGLKSTDYSDVYIQDRINNTTQRVSISSSGTQANGNSFRPSISPDGNLVVFHSEASNLVPNDTNLVSDVFVHDKRTGQTLRVSSPDAEMLLLSAGNTQSNGPSYNATISTSPAGIFVVYESLADNLTRRSVIGAIIPDTNRSQDIFLYDLLTSRTTRVNINDSGLEASNVNPRLNGDSYGAKISRDGKSIVFRSEATNLVPGDTNGLSDVFVFNRSVNGAITLDQPLNTSLKRVNLRIDQSTGFGAQATRDLLLGGTFPDRGSSYFPDLSSNGRYVVYASEASSLSGAPASINFEYGLPGIVTLQVTGFPRMKHVLSNGVVENPTATPVITISNGSGVTSTFEFVDNYTADESNIEVAVKSTDTNANIAASLARAINLKVSSITASAVGDTVTLTHSLAGYTPDVSSELDAKLSPPTVIRQADTNLNVGDIITVSDGATTRNFEAVKFGSVATPGNIPFAVGLDGETTRDLLISAINQAGLNVVARVESTFFNGGQTLSIVSKKVGPAPGGFAVSVTSLLSFSPQQQRFIDGTTFVNNGAANVYLTDRDFDGNGIFDEVGLIGGVSGMKSVLISRSPTGELGIGYYSESARNYYRPDSLEPTISADGRFVAYRSLAVNLLPPSVLRSDSIEVANSYFLSTDIAENSVIAQFSDYNETEDVYVHDRDPGLTGDPQLYDVGDITKSFFRNTVNTRVSVNKFGFQTSGLIGLPNIPASRQPQISPDGRYVVFVSDADNNGGIAFDQTNLEPLDNNQKRDVFFLDRRFAQDPSVDRGFPISTILSPVIGNTFSTGSSVVITASATDTNRNGSISSVEYFVNGTSIGFYEPGISDALSGRYSMTWNVPNNTGLLNLYTKVTDNEGNVSTSPVVQVSALVAIGQIPVFSPSKVSISRNPIPFGSSATLSVVVSDADGRIAGVDFFANGQLIGTIISAPYSIAWNPTVGGIYDIRAIARDNDGNSRSTSEAVLATVARNVAPFASITEPTSNISVRIGASISLIAAASDADGSIVKAEFFANGASVAVVNNPSVSAATQWTPSEPGDYNISVVVTDDLGVKSTNAESRIVTVLPIIGSPPAVNISAPTLSSGESPGTAAASIGSQVLLVADATDNTTVASVKFYADGILLGAASRQGSSNHWALRTALDVQPFVKRGVGVYLLTALAADSDGNQTQSATLTLNVTANVGGSAPTGSLVFPTAGSINTLGQALPLQALVNDVDGAVASVAFYANGLLLATDTTAPFTGSWTPALAGSYNLVLAITDAQGVSTVTAPVGVTVGSVVGNLPAVNAVFPTATTLNNFTTQSTIPLVFDVLDSDQPIAINPVVRFYVDGVMASGTPVRLGASSSFYLEYAINGLAVGDHTVVAVATDAAGNSALATTSFTVRQATSYSFSSRPVLTASKTSLTAGDTFSYSLEASRVSGRLVQMDVYLNGYSTPSTGSNENFSINPVKSAPFISYWYSGQFDGKTGSFAIGTDDVGNVMVSNVVEITRADNGLPSISVVAPGGSTVTTLGQSIVMDVEAKATTAGDIIKQVTFEANSSAPIKDGSSVTRLAGTDIYRLTWTPTLANVYAIKAIATTRGAAVDPATGEPFARSVASETRIFTVNPVVGSPPTLTLLTPTSTSTTTGGNTTGAPAVTTVASRILLAARAILGSGSITQVEFFARSTTGGPTISLGLGDANTVNSAYQKIAEPLAFGLYDIFGLVTDNFGNRIQSNISELNVTAAVVGAAPTGSLVSPNAGSVHTLGQVIKLQASAVDNEGDVASVAFYANGELVENDTSAPFSAEWTPTVAGNYNVTLAILDAQGTTTITSPVPVVVKRSVGVLPQVTALAPTVSLNTTGIYEFEAVATDADGTNLNVSFMLNSEIIGAGVYSSTTKSWLSPKVNFATRGAGLYSLTATVVDSDANRVNSSPVTFTVSTSTVDSIFGVKLNEVFLSLIGRNSTDTEMKAYFAQFGPSVLDYELAAALVQTSVFKSSGAVVINAYRAVFGEYPNFSAYRDGLAAINSGVGKVAYIDSLYTSSDYFVKFGAFPSFANNAAIEKFAADTHFNLTGVKPSTTKSSKMTASDWGLSVSELDAVLRSRKSERSVIAGRFSGLTSQSVGAAVAAYIEDPIASDKLLKAMEARARVAGIILAITEPNTAISLGETDGLSSYNLLDVAELYGTGYTDAAFKPIFRVLPYATSVVAGTELKLKAVVISSAGATTNELNSNWTYNQTTTLGSGTAVRSSWPVHEFTYTVPVASIAVAGTYDFSVTNRSGTTSAPRITVTVTPAAPVSLPLVNSLKVGVPFTIDLGDDRAGMTYVAKPLPAGLKLNSSTGVISGTPKKAGSVVVSYYTVLGKVSSPVKRTTFVVSR